MSKAVIIKGPQLDSRSFITVLPDSMDALVQKARDLFSVPPNHTPHFTLADDSNVIVLPDFLPLIREREVLIFRWTPDTPRSSLRRSIGQPITVMPSTEQVAVSSPSIDDGSKDESIKISRAVRWDDSVICNEEKNKRQLPRSRNQKESRDSVASRQRAEYVKQKIQEQEEIRRREQEAQSSASTEVVVATAVTADDPFVTSVPVETSSIPSNITLPLLTTDITKEDLLASGSSPPGYSSPTPKLTGATEEEQQTSSPLASPTRDVRGARKTDQGMAWMMGLGMEKQQQQADHEEAESNETEGQDVSAEGKVDKAVLVQEEVVMRDIDDLTREEAAVPEQATVDEPAPQISSTPVDVDELEEERAVEQITSPIKRQEVNVKDIASYQTMKSVVNQLRSHPSNQWFRQPCQEDLQRFCQERNRPVVDLFTISNAITLGEYGLDDPLKHFKSDLDQMWNNIRTFYPPQSQQSHCASMLETFSGILLEEWKRNSNAANRAIRVRPIKPRPHSTPISRGEKHPMKPNQDDTPKTQQQAYFASLVAKAGLAASKSPSGVQTSKTGNSTKRPAPLPASRMEKPIKKAQLSPLSAAPAPVLTVNNDNSAITTTTTTKAQDSAPRLITRNLAKQFAA